MFYIFFYLGLLTSVANSLVARDSRAERLKIHKETRAQVRADADVKFKKARTIDSIAAAQQENRVLSREALVSAWAQREKEKVHRHTSWGQYAHVFMAPQWETSMQRFFGSHMATVEYSYAHVSRGFNDAGEIVDNSVVRFGKQAQLRDILLASKIMSTPSTLPAAGGEFLEQLSSLDIPFQSSLDTHECALNYQIGFANNRFQIGVHVPLRHQVRTIRSIPYLMPSQQTLLNDRDAETDNPQVARNEIFRSLYGVSVPAMIEDVIQRKNMVYREYLRQASVGDMSFFATLNFFPWRLDRWSVSAELIVPGKKDVDTNYFYPIIPESRGFLSAKMSTGFVGRKTMIGAPHLMASCQIYIPTDVKMRVPRMVSLVGDATLPSTEVFSQEVTFNEPPTFKIPECSIPDFASHTAVATLRPGFALDFRVGSVIHPFISPLIECDVYYHFHMRGSDEVRSELSVSDWYPEALASVPYRAQHRIGLSVIYQPTAHLSLKGGISGVVAGRSMPLDVTGTASIGWSW